ncbi:MAG: hypothetical protein ACFFBD_11280 [Candidatus Hodarchaeota archaeon]
MKIRTLVVEVSLTAILLLTIPLGASQSTTSQSSHQAVFADVIQENRWFTYKITEFETPSGASSGPAALGPDGYHTFWGSNVTITEGDIIRIKVDSRTDDWEAKTGDSSLLYTPWDYGCISWGSECKIFLYPGGEVSETDIELDAVFSRMALFPIQQRIFYWPPTIGITQIPYLTRLVLMMITVPFLLPHGVHLNLYI